MIDVAVTVIGGGVVGCAVAAAAAKLGLSTVLLEKESALARGTTSRNSEVVHGGMYYPAGSAKARLCVRGRRLLREFCQLADLSYCECGKLIVAVDESEMPRVDELHALGLANGVEDLSLVDGRLLQDMEPQVRAVGALYSPRTAILDAEAITKAFAAQAAEQGAQILTAAEVSALQPVPGGWEVTVAGGGEKRKDGWKHRSSWVVNAAGLYSDRIAELAGVPVTERGWRLHWVKGNYFTVNSAHFGRVSRLIYPVPPQDDFTLGVHICLDLAGQIRLGPDVEFLSIPPQSIPPQEDYSVDAARREDFFAGAARFLPWLALDDLAPAFSGLRPRLAPREFRDFVIQPESGSLAGLINLVGIDSPGLTSAPAIAEEVALLLQERPISGPGTGKT